MVDPLIAATRTAASGMQGQSMRMRVISENLANVESAGTAPGSDPYRRKVISFQSALDEATGANILIAGQVIRDRSAFRSEFRPDHPAANGEGYVKLPNVNMIVEVADMREAVRSYEANLQVVRQARDMISMTLDLLKA